MTAALPSLTHTVLPATVQVPAGLTQDSSATVVIFNATPVTATVVSVGSAIVSPSGGLKGFTAGTQAPASCSAQVTSLSFSIQVEFATSPASGWQSSVGLGSVSVSSVCLWCFQNGFVLTMPDGAMVQISFMISR